MRRGEVSVTLIFLLLVITSAFYLLIPDNFVTSRIEDFIYGIDNRFSSLDEVDQNVSVNSELMSENERLRSELNLIPANISNYVTGKVVAKSVQHYRSTIDINIGRNQGVKTGDSVLSNGKLIGRVIESDQNRSKILTLSDPDFRATIFIEGTNIEGLVSPVPGGLIVGQIAGTESSKHIGSKVLTSGLGGFYPPGIPLGTLGDEISEEGEIFKEFVLEEAASLASIIKVVVVP